MKYDYSKYECPYSHIEKECGHELVGPEGYTEIYGVWCACGFRGPVFCLDPEELYLEKKAVTPVTLEEKVLEAADYIESGTPYRDAMDDYDVMDAICLLAGILKEKVG